MCSQESDPCQVISSLGIFNSRVHLVSMAEAVKGDPTEEPKFRNQIPSIAQVRWCGEVYFISQLHPFFLSYTLYMYVYI